MLFVVSSHRVKICALFLKVGAGYLLLAPRQRRKWSQRTKSGLLTQSVWCNLESENEKTHTGRREVRVRRLQEETRRDVVEDSVENPNYYRGQRFSVFIFSRRVSKSIIVLFLARVS